MNDNDIQETYEAPSFEAVGDLHEITKASDNPFGDALPFEDNTAFGPS